MTVYKLIIVDNNGWMYSDMAYQIIHQLASEGHEAKIIPYEYGKNNNEQRYIFIGTAYSRLPVPPGSIVTNFDNDTLLFLILTPQIINTCTIWDYSQENIKLLKEKYPNSDCHLFQMGYSSLLDHKLTYDENKKDIDVLLLGNVTERRSKILNKLSENGFIVHTAYGKIGIERASLLARTKIAVSIYGSDHTHCISASRFTPILCNNGFIVTENCSNKKQNDYWSQYTISVDYDDLYDTIVSYLKQPEKRKELADKFYTEFRKTISKIIK